MRVTGLLLGAIVLVAACSSSSTPTPDDAGESTTTADPSPEPDVATAGDGPDLILHNGNVVTVDTNFSIVTALAVDDGVIVAIGDDHSVLALAGSATSLVDLGGRSVLPGFVDPHIHSVQNQTPDLAGMADEQRILLEYGTTTIGTPAIIPFNMDAYSAMLDADFLLQRTHLYLQYNSSCDDRDPADYWSSLPFDRSVDQTLAVAGVKVFADGGACRAPAVGFDYLATVPQGLRDAGWVGDGDLYMEAE